MSIATQIERLQVIKGEIKNALISKGIAARDHNMADFAQDIRDIETGGGGGGTDVSDTTATVNDVLSGKEFYNAHGQKVEGTIEIRTNEGGTIFPSTVGPTRKNFPAGYYPNAHNIYVPMAYPLNPTDGNPVEFEADQLYLAQTNGFAYASEQAGGIPNMLIADSRGTNYPAEDTVTITKEQIAVLKYIRHAASGSTMTITINGESRTLSASTTHMMYTDSISLKAGDVVKIYAKSASTANVGVIVSLAYLE